MDLKCPVESKYVQEGNGQKIFNIFLQMWLNELSQRITEWLWHATITDNNYDS